MTHQSKVFDIIYLPAVIHVTFVAEDHFLNVLCRVLFNIPDPVLDVVKRLFAGDVVDEHDSHGASVVRRCNRPETLLAGGVPYLELDFLPVEVYRSNLKVNAWKKEVCLGTQGVS